MIAFSVLLLFLVDGVFLVMIDDHAFYHRSFVSSCIPSREMDTTPTQDLLTCNREWKKNHYLEQPASVQQAQ